MVGKLRKRIFSKTHRYGGIIPPIAQELHRQNIERVINETFTKSNLTPHDIDAIAVTNRPGLSLSLQIGVRYAKHLSRTYSKPIIPIHHMEAHALIGRMSHSIDYPFLCLLASGGHCILTLVHSVNNFELLGETLDDAPGESFDKIARRLRLRNLPEYEWKSGGQAIELAAKESKNPSRFEFPLPLARHQSCEFSFSGLKNTAKRHIAKVELEDNVGADEVIPNYEDFCAGFLRSITRHICHRTQRAIEYCELERVFERNDKTKKTLVFSGGVACNDFIFTALSQMAEQFGYETIRPPKVQCTDNGLMIAWNGVERWMMKNQLYANQNIDDICIEPKCQLGTDISKKITTLSIGCKWAKISILKS